MSPLGISHRPKTKTMSMVCSRPATQFSGSSSTTPCVKKDQQHQQHQLLISDSVDDDDDLVPYRQMCWKETHRQQKVNFARCHMSACGVRLSSWNWNPDWSKLGFLQQRQLERFNYIAVVTIFWMMLKNKINKTLAHWNSSIPLFNRESQSIMRMWPLTDPNAFLLLWFNIWTTRCKISHSAPREGQTTKLGPRTLKTAAVWVNFGVSRLSGFSFDSRHGHTMWFKVQSRPSSRKHSREKKRQKKHKRTRTQTAAAKNRRSECESRSLSGAQLSVAVAHFLQLIFYPRPPPPCKIEVFCNTRWCVHVAAWRAGWRRDTYRCDREVSEQMELRPQGGVCRHLGLQQAELQKPNGRDDSSEVKENHRGKPKKKKKRPWKERRNGLFSGTCIFYFIFFATR